MNTGSNSTIRLSVCVPSTSQTAYTSGTTLTPLHRYLPPSRGGAAAKQEHISAASYSGCAQTEIGIPLGIGVHCGIFCPKMKALDFDSSITNSNFQVVFVRDICFFADLVNLLDFIVKTFEVLQLKDVLVFLVLSGWLVTLFTSTGTLILAERKKNSEYVLPRIVQQGGLLVIGFLGVVLLIFYFTGGSTSINNALISVYEYVVLENPLTKDERKDVHDSLKYTFMLLIILDFFFICYTAFGLAITRKYQKSWRPTIQTLLEEVIKGSSNL
uniref:Uncharacterized protein n=1 Tax=Ditylenchus dipsaci TaxID=166011 RepID=A0A915DMF0_9BILA